MSHANDTERAPNPLWPRAQRNYPQSEYLQREWLRAVRVVRGSSRGWLLDQAVKAKS